MSPHDQKGFAYHRDFKNVKLLTHMTSALTKVLSLKHTHPIPCAHQGIKETLSYRADFIEPSSLETIKQELDLCNNNCIISVDGLLPKSELIDNDSDTLSSIGHAKNQASAIEALFQKLRQSGAIPSALPLVGTVDIKGQMVLLVDNVGALSHNDHFTKLIARSGLTPPMNQARAQFAQLAPEEMPLPHKNLTSQQRQPKSVKYYKNIHAFLNSTNIRSLMLASTPGNAKSIRNSGPNLLASATAKMILGLSKMIVEPLDPSVQASLKRIDELVKHSLTTSSFKEFSFYHELLHEEILFLLDKSRPYPSSRMDEMSSPHATFEEAYLQSKQALKRLPHRTPNVLAFNSCMACVDALIKAEVRMLGRPPKIAGLQGSYFEITDHFREDVKAQPDQSPSFISADHTLQDIKGLVDMLFLEVHPCANPDATEYQRNPVETIIKTALAKQSGNRLTVALDATLDKVDSKELMRLIDAFEAEVNSGALDIVIYRSAQKFDQLGVDRINAGYMEVYSENTLGDACKSVGGGLEGADYQMLTHLHAHAHAEIHQFQWLHSRWREIAAY